MGINPDAFWMTIVKKAAGYLVAGRGHPFWGVTGTVVAGSNGTGCVIGTPGLAYLHGWTGSAYPIGFGLGNGDRRSFVCSYPSIQVHDAG